MGVLVLMNTVGTVKSRQILTEAVVSWNEAHFHGNENGDRSPRWQDQAYRLRRQSSYLKDIETRAR